MEKRIVVGIIVGLITAIGLRLYRYISNYKTNLKIRNDEKDLLAEQNKERLSTLSKENLKKLKDSNLLTQEEYDSKLSQIANKNIEESIKKNNDYILLKNLYDSGVLNKIEFEEKTKILIEKQSIAKISDQQDTSVKISPQFSNSPTNENKFRKSTPPKKENNSNIPVILTVLFVGAIIIIGINGGFKKSESEEESFPDVESIPVAAVADTTAVTVPTINSTTESPELTSPVVEEEENQNGEMTVKMLEGIVRMSYNSFEDWAISHNYVYEKAVSSESCDFVYYKVDDSKRIIYSVSKDGGNFGLIAFATTDLDEFKHILNKCKEMGYKSYIDLENPNNNDSNSASYRKGSYEMTFSKKDEFYLIHLGII